MIPDKIYLHKIRDEESSGFHKMWFEQRARCVPSEEYIRKDALDSLQQEQTDFPITDEEIEMLLATHPKVEVPNKYKTPDWLWKKQEQPKKSQKSCNDCPHCVDRKDQFGWHFKGCFGGPYKGKFIAEIDECPLQQEPIEKYNETEKLIVRDIIEATEKRVNIDKQDKDKEEEAMLEKINYLRNLGLNAKEK